MAHRHIKRCSTELIMLQFCITGVVSDNYQPGLDSEPHTMASPQTL